MIKAYASMIREISGDDKVKRDKHAQVIIDEADRLAALVGDVLDLSKLQAGIEKEEFSVFNLSEDVYAVTNRFDFYVETEGYTIHTDIDDDLYTFAARGRVEQVLYNLIGNAISYTGADKSILVRLKAGKDCSHFEVIDTARASPKRSSIPSGPLLPLERGAQALEARHGAGALHRQEHPRKVRHPLRRQVGSGEGQLLLGRLPAPQRQRKQNKIILRPLPSERPFLILASPV